MRLVATDFGNDGSGPPLGGRLGVQPERRSTTRCRLPKLGSRPESSRIWLGVGSGASGGQRRGVAFGGVLGGGPKSGARDAASAALFGCPEIVVYVGRPWLAAQQDVRRRGGGTCGLAGAGFDLPRGPEFVAITLFANVRCLSVLTIFPYLEYHQPFESVCRNSGTPAECELSPERVLKPQTETKISASGSNFGNARTSVRRPGLWVPSWFG